jgi:hypothetical protein
VGVEAVTTEAAALGCYEEERSAEFVPMAEIRQKRLAPKAKMA